MQKKTSFNPITVFVILVIMGFAAWWGLTSHTASTPVSTSDESSTEWDTYRVESQLPGAPAFTIDYPKYFGNPKVSVDISMPGEIHEKNAEILTFGKYMTIAFGIYKLSPGQTLANYADKQLTGTSEVQYDLVVDGHPTLVRSVSVENRGTYYFIEYKPGYVLGLLSFRFRQGETNGGVGESGTQARKFVDKVVQSIRF